MEHAHLIDLPKIIDKRGNLSFIQNGIQLPFVIKRCYWIYDVPSGEKRDGHAILNNKELIISLSGSFDVIVNDGVTDDKFSLNRPNVGLYIPQNVWREITDFSTNSVALVLSSECFNQEEYIYDFELYKSGITNECLQRF